MARKTIIVKLEKPKNPRKPRKTKKARNGRQKRSLLLFFFVGSVISDRSQRFATEEVDLELLEHVFLGRVVKGGPILTGI